MKNLTAEKISQALKGGAKGKLNLNRHQRVDKRVPIKNKQEHVERDVRACGKADFSRTMKDLGKTL
jgi:hypothetical protein